MNTNRTPPTVATPTGIVIGSAYTPPSPRMSRDAEALQAVLLERRRREAEQRMRERAKPESYYKQDLLFIAGCLAAGLGGLAAIIWG